MLTHCQFRSLLRLNCVERVTDTVRARNCQICAPDLHSLVNSIKKLWKVWQKEITNWESNPQPELQVQGDQLHVKFRQTANNFYLKCCIFFFSFDFESHFLLFSSFKVLQAQPTFLSTLPFSLMIHHTLWLALSFWHWDPVCLGCLYSIIPLVLAPLLPPTGGVFYRTAYGGPKCEPPFPFLHKILVIFPVNI